VLAHPAAGGAAPWAATGPDRAFKTPIARGGAQAQTAVSGAALRKGLAQQLRRSGGSGGAWVGDPVTGATLFAGGASRNLRLASNMKLFTTATALASMGPAERFETRLVADGTVTKGVVQGDLILVGGGDPSLTAQGIGRLAAQARAAGLAKVTGRLLYDETVFDRKRAIPQPGISGGRFSELGRLSGLSYEGGRSADPARSAAMAMVKVLRKRGVSVSKKVARGTAPDEPPAEQLVAEVSSSPLSALARSTNVFSINFYAEMMFKSIAAEERGVGTTAGGAAIVKAFAREAGGSLKAVNGSGLSRTDIASPRSVGALLTHMLEQDEPVREAFLNSLAVAGRSGTLAGRMRGSAAQRRCIGKTGTLTGVSALSGYCEVAPDRFIAFSILMNRVDIGRAHMAQDRMVATIARYSP
jgi:D-alanyl-D-alanine carboxypeptidase/D-alanyl-D-alanine-endopeptidase (penicillin-binding protein 4)